MTIKTFVLIYMLTTGNGAATGSVEFASLGECERAANAMKEHVTSLVTTVRYVCVEKTTIPVAR